MEKRSDHRIQKDRIATEREWEEWRGRTGWGRIGQCRIG